MSARWSLVSWSTYGGDSGAEDDLKEDYHVQDEHSDGGAEDDQ